MDMKRTNLLLDVELLAEARRLTGAKTDSAAVTLALEEFVRPAGVRLNASGTRSGEKSAVNDGVAPPWLDYALIPDEYEGRWVLLRVDPALGTQEVVRSGETLQEATQGRAFGDSYVVTRVPHRRMTVVVGDAETP